MMAVDTFITGNELGTLGTDPIDSESDMFSSYLNKDDENTISGPIETGMGLLDMTSSTDQEKKPLSPKKSPVKNLEMI